MLTGRSRTHLRELARLVGVPLPDRTGEPVFFCEAHLWVFLDGKKVKVKVSPYALTWRVEDGKRTGVNVDLTRNAYVDAGDRGKVSLWFFRNSRHAFCVSKYFNVEDGRYLYVPLHKEHLKWIGEV